MTQAEIFEAADRIAARGERPTLDAVRAELGGGSFRDISAGMRKWRSRRKRADAEAGAPPGPVAEQAALLARQLWAAALQEASERQSAERAAAEKRQAEALAQAEAERDEAASLADRLAASLEEARARCAQLEADLDAAHRETARREGELREARAQFNALLGRIGGGGDA